MRNPYRRTACYSLRGFLVGVMMVLAALQVAMVVMLVDVITTPDSNGAQPTIKPVLGCAGLLLLLLLSVRGAFFLTSGWDRLWVKPWKALGQGMGSLAFAIVYSVMVMTGHALWSGTVGQVMMAVVWLAVMLDLLGTGLVFVKVRKK